VAEPKLVVTTTKGGSKITLIGSSGTPLLTSKVFSEPRGKGATLRALKGLLGEGVAVDDQTLPARETAPSTVTTRRRTTRSTGSARTRRSATSSAKTRTRAVAARATGKTSRVANASGTRRRAIKKSAKA
jgi:hypothetical protein